MKGKKIKLRKATIDDAEDLFELRNDPVVSSVSINTGRIQWEDHVKWLEKKLASHNTVFLIAEENGQFIGQIRFDKQWIISISLTKPFRGKGLSVGLINAATAMMDAPVIAQIKNDNTPSLKAFRKAGFMEVE